MKSFVTRFWIPLGTLLIALFYVPMLSAPFDFIDDGNLVYPTRTNPDTPWLDHVWDNVESNYDHLGAFRPTLHLHWQIQRDLIGPSPFAWHLWRLVWCAMAAGMLLWFLKELGFRPIVAMFIAAAAFWNRMPNEVWISLTLGEGVAMPWALLALVAARKAPTSRRPWAWDMAGVIGLLMALGCKNTFVALAPAMAFLRVAPDHLSLREGIRRHWLGAAVLCLPVIMPVAHYLYFKANWQPGQYVTKPPSLGFVTHMLSLQMRAASVDFLGAGLALCIAAIIMAKRVSGSTPQAEGGESPAAPASTQSLLKHRATIVVGFILLICGMGIYLPIGAYGGRYTIPAVWGSLLLVGLLVSAMAKLKSSHWTRAAWIALIAGLLGVVISANDKRQKMVARAELFWDALYWVEANVPDGAAIAWLSGDSNQGALNVEEGIHFQWHLDYRGKSNVRIVLYDEAWQPIERVELPVAQEKPALAIWGRPTPTTATMQTLADFEATYRFGRKKFECHVGRQEPPSP